MNDLQCYSTIEKRVARQVDFAHPPSTHQANHPEVVDHLVRLKERGILRAATAAAAAATAT
ncbi:MAG: hypothetical protein V2A73_02545 [Pseudomonadota bacterium]